MILFIRLWPLIAACSAYILLELARNMRRKGKSWVMIALFALFILSTIVLWVYYRGYINAEKWAKEFAAINYFLYSRIV